MLAAGLWLVGPGGFGGRGCGGLLRPSEGKEVFSPLVTVWFMVKSRCVEVFGA